MGIRLSEMHVGRKFEILGPVVITPVSTHPGLNNILTQVCFVFFFIKSTLSDNFLFLEYPVIKWWAKRIILNLLFNLSYLSSNLVLTLGYLNQALKQPSPEHLQGGTFDSATILKSGGPGNE